MRWRRSVRLLTGFSPQTLGNDGAIFDTNGFDIGVSTAFASLASQNSGLRKLGLGSSRSRPTIATTEPPRSSLRHACNWAMAAPSAQSREPSPTMARWPSTAAMH